MALDPCHYACSSWDPTRDGEVAMVWGKHDRPRRLIHGQGSLGHAKSAVGKLTFVPCAAFRDFPATFHARITRATPLCESA